MATTISYNGATIMAVGDADTRVLHTSGKYLNDNLTIVNSGGGTGTTLDEFLMKDFTNNLITGSATQIPAHAFSYYITNGSITASFPQCTSIGARGFASCGGLTSAIFPECLVIGSSAFYSCSYLNTISFPKCTTISIQAFYFCTRLTQVSLPECQMIYSNAFYACYYISEAYLPKCSIVSNYAFGACSSLATVIFGSSCATISSSAFDGCWKLLTVDLSTVSSVPALGNGAFNNSPIANRTTSTAGVYGSIYVPASLYDAFKTATNWSAYSSRMVSV